MNKTSDAEQPIVNWLTGGGEMGKLIKVEGLVQDARR